MAIIEYFLLPEELEINLKKLAEVKGLIGYRSRNQEYELFDLVQASSLFLAEEPTTNQLFLLPASQELPNILNDEVIAPRYMLCVTPGQLIQNQETNILTMTTIQSDDKKDLPFKASNWITWLKRQLASSTILGVEGANIKYGGKSIYKNMGYSQKALQLFHEGVIWKQHETYNSVFYPLNSDSFVLN
jgi:hypothetical protein